jgi:hypothetical protein
MSLDPTRVAEWPARPDGARPHLVMLENMQPPLYHDAMKWRDGGAKSPPFRALRAPTMCFVAFSFHGDGA